MISNTNKDRTLLICPVTLQLTDVSFAKLTCSHFFSQQLFCGHLVIADLLQRALLEASLRASSAQLWCIPGRMLHHHD